MGSLNAGILAIWNDCRPGGEAEYEAWYRSEHLRERVAIAGFQFGRRYVAVDGGGPGAQKYFTYYETTGPGVLRSAAYVEKGGNPSPLTRHIMTTVFANMSRTICVREASDGSMRGTFALTVRASELSAQALANAWPQVLSLGGRVRSELWVSAETGQAASAEEQMRASISKTGDAKVGACLFAEFADEASAAAAVAAITGSLTGKPEIAIGNYRLFCTLDQRDLRS
jgi:hypothetical protein